MRKEQSNELLPDSKQSAWQKQPATNQAYWQLKAMPVARTRQISLDARRFAGLMSRTSGQARNHQAGRSS